MRRQTHQNTTQHMQRYVYQEWLQTENELTRERGLWGPLEPCYLDKWMLDMTEGPNRMRKKTMKNEMFYLHYPFKPEHEKGTLKYKVILTGVHLSISIVKKISHSKIANGPLLVNICQSDLIGYIALFCT